MTQTTPEPTEDAELARLLAVCCNHAYAFGGARNSPLRRAAFEREDAARTALLAYHAATYVRRDANHLPPSPPGSYREARGILPWRPGDELPEDAIRRLRDGAEAD
jgi:hypothetical protein